MKKDIIRFGLTAFLLTFSFSILLQGAYYFNKAVLQVSLLVQEEDEEEEEDSLKEDLLEDAKDEFKNIQKKLKFRDRQIRNIKADSDAISEAQAAFGILKQSSAELNEALGKNDSELFFDLKSDFDEKDSELEDLIEDMVKANSSKKIETFITFKKQQRSEMQKVLEDFQKAENENNEDEEDEDNKSGKEILTQGAEIIQNFNNAINTLQEEYEEAENDTETLEILAGDLENRNPEFQDAVAKFAKLTGQTAAFKRLEKKMKKVEKEFKKEPKKEMKNEPKRKITPKEELKFEKKKSKPSNLEERRKENPKEESKPSRKESPSKYNPKKRLTPGKNVSKIRTLIK